LLNFVPITGPVTRQIYPKEDTIMGDRERLPTGFVTDIISLPIVTEELLYGHVSLIEGIILPPTFVGCYAVVALRDTPGTDVGVVTSEQRLQSLLETALATGSLMGFVGHKIPVTPWGATAGLDLYAIDKTVIVYAPK
jgi:hypothetical protein